MLAEVCCAAADYFNCAAVDQRPVLEVESADQQVISTFFSFTYLCLYLYFCILHRILPSRCLFSRHSLSSPVYYFFSFSISISFFLFTATNQREAHRAHTCSVSHKPDTNNSQPKLKIQQVSQADFSSVN